MSRLVFTLASLISCMICAQGTLSAQAFEAGGGTSSLYQAGGGSISMHAPSYDWSVGAGTVSGHIVGGAQVVKATKRGKYIFGDDRIDFHLPTDIFDTSHFVIARGAGFSANHAKIEMMAFAGTTSSDFSSPLFEGAKSGNAAGILFVRMRLTDTLQLFSDTIFSSKMTHISALQWSPAPKLDLAVGAGMGANQRYFASSANFARDWIDMQAAYISAGPQFRRVAVISPLLAEPNHENLLVNLKPWTFLTFTGAHQNYLVPQTSSLNDVSSSVDQGSTSLRPFGAHLTATMYHSTYQSASNHAAAFTAGRDFGERFRVTSSYFASRPRNSAATNSFVTTVSQVLSARLTVNENLTNSAGRTSMNFGGQFLSNILAVSADYETFYVPANNSRPFEQALVLDFKFNLFGRIALHGASFVDPTGRLRYTADAHAVMTHGQMAGGLEEHVSIGSSVARGCVVDVGGQPVEGAALRIDESKVYTDSDGCFFIREQKSRSHNLTVEASDFLDSGDWRVVSAPSVIVTSPEKSVAGEKPVEVVVQRIRREAAAKPALPGGSISPK